VELAGVVGVGVEDGHGKGHLLAVDADLFPVQVGGKLQRQVCERRLAVVADRDQSTHGEMAFGRAQADVEVEIGVGERVALVIFRGGLLLDFARLLAGWRFGVPQA
jgi:hypothetical protein